MNIIGTAARYHDGGTALVQDGKLINFVEEERLERYKHGTSGIKTGGIPIQSLRWSLKNAGLTIKDIDYVTFAEDYILAAKQYPKALIRDFRYYASGGLWGVPLVGALAKFLMSDPYRYNRAKNYIRKELGYCPPVKMIDHHTSHASSAFRCSGFKKANILSIDGIGSLTTGLFAVGNGTEIEEIKRLVFPHSLGALYSTVTKQLGYRENYDEGKVMGLAAYGNPYKYWFDDVLSYGNGDFKLDWAKLWKKFPIKRDNKPFTQKHKDMAASVQKTLEDIVIDMTQWLYDQTGYKKLCLVGGVALNCSMNGKILQQDYVDDIFIQPAAGDGGTQIGSALELAKSKFKMEHAYYGPEYSDEEIEATLKECKLKYSHHKNIATIGAELLEEDAIIGCSKARWSLVLGH